MGANTKIEWAHHTWSPWRGCFEQSPGCDNCYAKAMAKRNPGTLGEWTEDGARPVGNEAYWRLPLKWDKAAACQCGGGFRGTHSPYCPQADRPRVFCASMADVFEDWQGPDLLEGGERLWWVGDKWSSQVGPAPDPDVDSPATLNDVRQRLFALIDATPNLDWLLLTKRPENVGRMIPDRWSVSLPKNVWLGTSVENQAAADERVPHLLKIKAAVRFLSCEPLLGPVDLWPHVNHPHKSRWPAREYVPTGPFLDWVIVGGESGPKARPMHPDWARSLRDQCTAAGVAFHFKQWGEWFPSSAYDYDTCLPRLTGRPEIYVGPRGEVTRCASTFEHGCPCCAPPGHVSMVRVGKVNAGRLLDGREWNDFPKSKGGAS